MTHEQYLQLVTDIRRHMKLYYDEDVSEISDYEYDQLMLQLKAAEKEHPEWVTPDSPTQVVGGTATDLAGRNQSGDERGFAESDAAGLITGTDQKGKTNAGKRKAGVLVEHDVPMLSIQDVFTKEEVIAWVHEVRQMHSDVLFSVEEKIDGLSMSLRYADGKLTLAETRGDGLTGEDVTPNTKAIEDVPQNLKTAYEYLEVRGEVYMTHADFDRTNELMEARGKKTFANPRNCAAGTLRQLDAGMVRERGLSFFVFNIQKTSDSSLFASHTAGLKILHDKEGLKTVPFTIAKTDEEILAAIDGIGEKRGSLDYDIDGAVVKIDQVAYRGDFPAGSKYSAGHIAYKYPPEEKEAVITDVELTVGMTGRINPTAIFTPIKLCGTTVSRATLHNQDFIDKLGIGIGKKVLVYKSGEIIPKIKEVVGEVTSAEWERIILEAEKEKEKSSAAVSVFATSDLMSLEKTRIGNHASGIYQIPSVCPACGGQVLREPDTADMRCMNEDCPAKLIRRVIHFVSRDAMDMKGFGDEYIRALIEKNYIRNIADLYTLKHHRDKLVREGLIGKEINTDKLLSVIEESKNNEPWRLLCGLSIANVGRTSARTLMRHFKSMEALQDAPVSVLTEVEDIGEITAKAITDWFAKPAHRELIERLLEAGVRMSMADTQMLSHTQGKAESVSAVGQISGGIQEGDSSRGAEYINPANEALLAGRTYCVTGDVTHFKNRDELIDFIESRGGKVAGSVSKKTFALINNDVASTSGKNKKAKDLGIPVISEENFLRSCEGG